MSLNPKINSTPVIEGQRATPDSKLEFRVLSALVALAATINNKGNHSRLTNNPGGVLPVELEGSESATDLYGRRRYRPGLTKSTPVVPQASTSTLTAELEEPTPRNEVMGFTSRRMLNSIAILLVQDNEVIASTATSTDASLAYTVVYNSRYDNREKHFHNAKTPDVKALASLGTSGEPTDGSKSYWEKIVLDPWFLAQK